MVSPGWLHSPTSWWGPLVLISGLAALETWCPVESAAPETCYSVESAAPETCYSVEIVAGSDENAGNVGNVAGWIQGTDDVQTLGILSHRHC